MIHRYAVSDAPAFLLNLGTQAHNIFVHTLAETGIVGLAGFSVVVIASLVGVMRRLRAEARGPNEARAGLDEFAFLAMVTLLVIGLLHFVLYHSPVALLFWYGLGVCAGPWPLKSVSPAEA
jgi:O-antigen ligase